MKKILTHLSHLSGFRLSLGLLALLVASGGILWGVHDSRQDSNAKEQTKLTQAAPLSGEQLTGQPLKAGLEVTSHPGQQVQPTNSNSPTSQSAASSSYGPASRNTGGTTGQSSPLQYTQPVQPTSGSTPTSPSYPNDNGDTPQVTLTNPGYWKQPVSGSFMATATASDSSGINRVVFMLRKIGQVSAVQTVTDTTAPYSAIIDVSGLPNGDSDYAVEAQVFDNTGKGNLASYRITIQN